jgi:hypothetical protein
MENLFVLPGVERRDLEQDIPSVEVLQNAIDVGVSDVIVIGRERSGEFYIASAVADADRVVGRLMWAVQFLASHEVIRLDRNGTA